MLNIGTQETVFESGKYEYIDAKVVINNHEYGRDSIQQLRIIGDLYAQNTLSFGGCCSRQLGLVLSQDSNVIPKQAKIEVYKRVVADPSNPPAWFRKGVFYIDTRENIGNTGRVRITAYDSMLKAEADYHLSGRYNGYITIGGTDYYRDSDNDGDIAEDTAPYAWSDNTITVYTTSATPSQYDATYYDTGATSLHSVIDSYSPSSTSPTMASVAYDIAGEICEGLDSRCSFENYPLSDEDIETLNERYSQREVLGIIAAAHGGNFIITDEDKLLLVRESASATKDFDMTNAMAAKMDIGESWQPISKVELAVGDTIYESGTDTGRTVSIKCDLGTQAIANALLTQLQGLTYTSYSAESIISPAVEMGDRFEYDNTMFVVAHVDSQHNNSNYVTMSSPSDGDIEHEYPFKSSESRETTRSIANKLDSKGGDEHEFAWKINKQGAHLYSDGKEVFRVTDTEAFLNGIINAYGGRFEGSGIEVTSGNRQSTIDNLSSESISSNKISADSMDTRVISATGDTPNDGIYLNKTHLYDRGVGGNPIITTITFSASPTNCSVGADYINFGVTITASAALPALTTVSAFVEVEVRFGTEYQTFGIAMSGQMEKGSTSITLQKQKSYKASTTGTFNSASVRSYSPTTQTYTTGDISGIYLSLDGVSGLVPSFPNAYDLGHSISYWKDMYAVNFNQVSDKRKKKDISYSFKEYDKVFDELKPATYKIKDSADGLTHIGFIAQDVISAFKSGKIDTKDMGIVNYGDVLSLRYTEFIALNTYQIQKLKSRIAELEERLNKLENKEK